MDERQRDLKEVSLGLSCSQSIHQLFTVISTVEYIEKKHFKSNPIVTRLTQKTEYFIVFYKQNKNII